VAGQGRRHRALPGAGRRQREQRRPPRPGGLDRPPGTHARSGELGGAHGPRARITDVSAGPATPAADEPVTVSVTVPGQTSATLRYRTDFAAEQTVAMTPARGDVYTATAPGVAPPAPPDADYNAIMADPDRRHQPHRRPGVRRNRLRRRPGQHPRPRLAERAEAELEVRDGLPVIGSARSPCPPATTGSRWSRSTRSAPVRPRPGRRTWPPGRHADEAVPPRAICSRRSPVVQRCPRRLEG
jgi:hypothetical protein